MCSCDDSDIAVSVLATVVGVYPERGTALIDAGSRALGKDELEHPPHSKWATIVGHPKLRLQSISQGSFYIYFLRVFVAAALLIYINSVEVGIVSGEGASLLTVGMQLRLLPNHSCLTATNFDSYHVIGADGTVEGVINACPRGF